MKRQFCYIALSVFILGLPGLASAQEKGGKVKIDERIEVVEPIEQITEDIEEVAVEEQRVLEEPVVEERQEVFVEEREEPVVEEPRVEERQEVFVEEREEPVVEEPRVEERREVFIEPTRVEEPRVEERQEVFLEPTRVEDRFEVEQDVVSNEVIPEPATMSLLGMGLAGLALLKRKRG